MIKLYSIEEENALLRPQIDEAIKRVINIGRFVLGEQTEALEHELATFVGVKHAICVSSGTDALYLAITSLDLDRYVYTTPFTFIATSQAIQKAGLEYCYRDIDDNFLLPEVISNQFVVGVSLFGRPYEGKDLQLIVDNAQALGVPPRGRISTTSFYPTKNLGGIGDGGAVFTNEDDLAELIRSMRNHGVNHDKTRFIHDGGNYRMDEINAAVLRCKLPFLQHWNAMRRFNAAYYEELFGNYLDIPVLTPTPHLYHVWNQYVIRAPDRDGLRDYLKTRGIETGIYYKTPLHLEPCYKWLGYKEGSFPNAEKASKECLSLPVHPRVQRNELEMIVEEIARFYGW